MEREDEYYEIEPLPEKNYVKGALLSPFAAIFSAIVVLFSLAAIIISTPFAFIISLIKLSFDLKLTGKYTLSVVDKIATVAFALVFETWYKIFHKSE
ncbi:MAG TPA: hypothetical protein IAB11_04465 [Candidatus Ornithoclostridium faecavium]|nr:hypothetical protein [Candidatus Ornithoclostridium faecavium]